MNKKTKRNLKKVVIGGLMVLTLTTVIPSGEALAVGAPIVHSIKQPTTLK